MQCDWLFSFFFIVAITSVSGSVCAVCQYGYVCGYNYRLHYIIYTIARIALVTMYHYYMRVHRFCVYMRSAVGALSEKFAFNWFVHSFM